MQGAPTLDSTQIAAAIDQITPSEYSCAGCFHALFPQRFQYSQDGCWYHHSNGEWVADPQKHTLKHVLRSEFFSLLMGRAKQLQDRLNTQQNECDHDTSFRVLRLMDISRKLQSEVFLRNVLRELIEWYNTE